MIEFTPYPLPHPTGGNGINPTGLGKSLRLLSPNTGPLIQHPEIFLARSSSDPYGLREQPDSL
jgi:hypothetical protein